MRWRGLPLLLALAVPLGGCVAERPEDPVVLTGADVPRLQGHAPDRVVAFKWLDERWRQVPVQVDERARLDLAKPLNAAPVGHTAVVYTDPATWTGPDPDPNVDADDEIAFMGIDAGVRAPAGSAPAGVVTGSGQEVRVGDAIGEPTPAYVYLFRQTGGLDPGAGADRSNVDYRFNLLSGDYKGTYKLGAGPNPEDSTVTTPFYSHHFSDRWVDDALRVTAPNASGVDLLDRHKSLFAPGQCVRTETTFSNGAGAMIANKSGPVRAIREYIGANSGRLTARRHVFYARRHEVTTFLRVHAIPSVMDFFDYTPAAIGMTYRSSADDGGARIDGDPDDVTPGYPAWETVDGPQGSVAHVHTLTTDTGVTPTSYHLDDSTPPVTQCTGDGAAYGSSGPWINQSIPNTDPTQTPAAKRLESTRTIFYDSPGRANGPRRAAQVASPLQVTVATHP